MNQIYQGKTEDLVLCLEDDSLDLIVTSPPYSDQRNYGGYSPKLYVAWFLYIAKQLKRALKPTGSFIVNIKERCDKGERSTYVMELILAMREQGWKYKEEYVWHKTSSFRGKWNGRLSDAWERIIHFTKTNSIKFYPDNVAVPASPQTITRAKYSSERDKQRVGSSLNPKFAGTRDRQCKETAHPTNVIHCPPVHTNTGHPAAYPKAIPEFFIKLMTEENDLVLDPFVGSGTSCVVAKNLGRQFLGFDLSVEYCELARKNLELAQPTLFDVLLPTLNEKEALLV